MTREEFINCLVDGYDGRPGTHTREDAEWLADTMIGNWCEGAVLDAEDALNVIQCAGYLHKDGYDGWIDQSGKLWVCNYERHERLAELMGTNSYHLEETGYAHVSDGRLWNKFRLTHGQRRTLKRIGVEIHTDSQIGRKPYVPESEEIAA